MDVCCTHALHVYVPYGGDGGGGAYMYETPRCACERDLHRVRLLRVNVLLHYHHDGRFPHVRAPSGRLPLPSAAPPRSCSSQTPPSLPSGF